MKSKNSRKPDAASFCEALKSADNFLLACHVLPEGDAIGSLLAMNTLLKRLGKKTTIAAEEDFPERLGILSSKGWTRVDRLKKKPSAFQALVVTDCPTLDRIGKVKELITPETVIFNIDHHVSNEYFGHHNYVCTDAAATGEAVFNLYKHLRMPLTKEDAKNLYVALSTDTGAFKYSNTSAKSHRIAAELIEAGIEPEYINDSLYATFSLNKIQLYSRLLSRVKTIADGRVAWVVMKREDLVHSGATDEDTEGFIDFLKYLREVKIAFFISELAHKESIRVSFRSKDRYDVNRLATFFKGGGHKKSAGCTFRDMTAEKAEQAIVEAIEKQFSELCKTK